MGNAGPATVPTTAAGPVPPPGLVGRSAAVVAVNGLIARVCRTSSTVLITGESGTGKEMAARAVHAQSARAVHPFIAVNCSSVPEPLLESELFGYVKGAFTGASRDKQGLFRAAGSGTILLDEIGDLPIQLQPKILRVLERPEITPVGATSPEPVHARILATTNRDLEQMVPRGTFRMDLYFRLNTVEIRIPPLRERPEDVETLAQHLLRRICGNLRRQIPDIDRDALHALERHSWPGNVRELANVLERLIVFLDGSRIRACDLPPLIHSTDQGRKTDDLRTARRAFEQAHIRMVLARWNGDKRRAAHALGIDLSALYRKLRAR